MEKYIKYISIFLICFIFLFTAPLLAQDDNLEIGNIDDQVSNIEADNIYINTHKEEINAVGNAKFINPQVEINAKKIVFKYADQIMTAVGKPLILKYEGRIIKGKSLTLDYEKGVANLSQASLDIDKFQFEGEDVDYLKDQNPNIIVKDAFYTTCIMDEPHYHYTAKNIQYYPNDKIVGKNITFWWSGNRLITLPRYVVNVTTDEEGKTTVDNSFPVPELGYNLEQGLYIELVYPYEFSTNNYGDLYYIREDKENINFDWNHKYILDSDKYIFFDFQQQRYLDNDEIVNEEREIKLGFDHKINENIDYRVYARDYEKLKPIPEEQRQTSLNFAVDYTRKKYNINADFGYDFRNEDRIEKVSTTYTPIKNLRTETYHEFTNEKLQKQKYSISQHFNKLSWMIKYLKGYNTDYLPYGNIGYSFNKDLDLSIGYGLVKEGTIKEYKTDYELDYNKNIKITKNFNIGFKQKIKHVNYPKADEKLTNYETAIYFNLDKRISKNLNLDQRLGYSIKDQEGTPLFSIDELDKDKVITSNTELDLYLPKNLEHWKINLDLAYSIPDQEFDTQKIGVTHEYDCYSYQINYNHIDKAIGFEFSFIN